MVSYEKQYGSWTEKIKRKRKRCPNSVLLFVNEIFVKNMFEKVKRKTIKSSRYAGNEFN